MPRPHTFAVKEYVGLNVPLIRTVEDVARALVCDPRRLRSVFLQQEGVHLWIHLLEQKITWSLDAVAQEGVGGDYDAYEVLERKLRAYRHHIPPPDRTWPPDVQAALVCIHADPFDADLSPAAIKEMCGLRNDSYARQFRRYMRVRVTEYVTCHRITMAKHLLEALPVKVGDVAAAVGYRTDAAFTKAFTQAEGCTPSAYCALHRHVRNGKQNFQRNGKADEDRIA